MCSWGYLLVLVVVLVLVVLVVLVVVVVVVVVVVFLRFCGLFLECMFSCDKLGLQVSSCELQFWIDMVLLMASFDFMKLFCCLYGGFSMFLVAVKTGARKK